MKAIGIPVTISSDAHKPVEVGMFMDRAAEVLLEVGYREACVYDGKGWVSEPLV
jgi:histidinol-phosphatase (PHP family)